MKGKGISKARNKSRKQRAHLPVWQRSLFPVESSVSALQDLEEDYAALLENARILHDQMEHLQDVAGTEALDRERLMAELALLEEGKMSSVLGIKPMGGVKAEVSKPS